MNDNVDFRAPADLYPAPSNRRGPLKYQRFETLAEAVRYAQEQLSVEQRTGVLIEADEIRYGSNEIAALYQACGYPLERTAPVSH